jgi:hypothetical protein
MFGNPGKFHPQSQFWISGSRTSRTGWIWNNYSGSGGFGTGSNLFKMIKCRTFNLKAVLRIRIQDPVLFLPLDPGTGIGFFRIPDLESQIPNPYF